MLKVCSPGTRASQVYDVILPSSFVPNRQGPTNGQNVPGLAYVSVESGTSLPRKLVLVGIRPAKNLLIRLKDRFLFIYSADKRNSVGYSRLPGTRALSL